MELNELHLEKAKLEEFEEYYAIKCEEFNLYWTAGNYKEVPKDRLWRFYKGCIENQNGVVRKEIYFIKDIEYRVVGYLYLDIQGDTIDIPIAVKKKYTGKGYGKAAVLLGLDMAKSMGFKKTIGKIREDNIASMKLYTGCGYTVMDEFVEIYSEILHKNIKMYTVYKDL